MNNQFTRYTHVESIPSKLENTQKWFAGIITNRLGKNNTIQKYSPHGSLIAEEASEYIVPSPTLRPHQRMQIYNQQFWWRMLNTLHANFPMTTRLFGTAAFNEKIAIPYLLDYPSNHWSLNVLGENMSKWITERYGKADKQLVLNAAQLDWAFMASFIAAQNPAPNLSEIAKENPESLLSTVLYLQPHITLFSWDYDLFTFRESLLRQGLEYWVEHRFPALPKGKKFYFSLYRNINNNMAWREIQKGEYLLLERFKAGSTIADACAFLETQETSVYESAVENLQKWIQEWTQAAWITSHARK